MQLLITFCRLADSLFNCSVVVPKEDTGQFTDTCAFLLTTTATAATCDDAAKAYSLPPVPTSDGHFLIVFNYFDGATGACCLASGQGQKCDVVTPLLSNGKCSASDVPKVEAACGELFHNSVPATGSVSPPAPVPSPANSSGPG